MSDAPTEICENLLVRALTNDGLVTSLAGEQPCFIESHSGGEEPQDVRWAVERCLLPCQRSGRPPYPPRHFADTLLKILATHSDRNRAIRIIQNWIWYHHFCLSKKRVNSQGSYGDLFEVDLGAVAVALKRQFEANKDELIHDVHWADVVWNSSNGLWGPLSRTSATIHDKLDGPDFAPDTP